MKALTWAQDGSNIPYISAVETTLDSGMPYLVQSKTEQTLDAYGNVTQTKLYNYDNLTTPARTYNYTYLAASNCLSGYVRNRLATASVTDGTQTITLANNSYNTAAATQSGYRNHDASVTTCRGNLLTSARPGETLNYTYDVVGNVATASGNQGSVTLSRTDLTNYTAPTAVTANTFTTSINYNSTILPISQTAPNGETVTIGYDSTSRPASVQSPYGATTTNEYSGALLWKSTTGGRWSRKSFDGFGRTTKVESGYTQNSVDTIVSVVDTEYDACNCSPLGRVKKTSLPHASGATAYWTIYSYDGMGRTLSVSHPDTSGH